MHEVEDIVYSDVWVDCNNRYLNAVNIEKPCSKEFKN